MPEPYSVPSRKSVRKAGDIFRKEGATSDELDFAINTLSQWRGLHSYPLNVFQTSLRKMADGLDAPIIAQRLKRMPSITEKLIRFPTMSLDRMQDIGGIRIILKRVSDVKNLHNRFRSATRWKHKLVLPPHDYIEAPKKDGYRSLHQVFKFESRAHPELNGLFIELQLRTRLQHAWATAVETLGIIEKSSFKTGEGSDDFKRFFKLSSALFAIEEKQPVLDELKDFTKEELIREIIQYEERLQITTKLRGLALSAKHIESSSSNAGGYHLMQLDVKNNRISLIPFSKKQLDIAEEFYKNQEKGTKNNPNISLVLISAGNVKEIKKAYPNYFLDTESFIKTLQQICAEG